MEINADGDQDVVDYQGRFVWYELMTTDVAAARTFYSKVLGWGVQDASMPGLLYTFFTAGNTFVSGLMELPEAARHTGTAPQWIGYVAVNDVDATVKRIRRLGGAVRVPPTDVVNVSRFSIVADPQQASLAVVKWLKPRGERLGDPAEPGRVGWHELLAADCEAAFDFYRELFDWQRADAGAAAANHRFAVRGQAIGAMFPKPPLFSAPLWLYYFNVRDINAAADRVKGAGGVILEGPIATPGGNRIVHCADPQGVVFALEGRPRHGIGYFAPAPPRAVNPTPE